MINPSNQAMIDAAVRLLREKGGLIESKALCRALAEYGADVAQSVARFPEKMSRAIIQDSARSEPVRSPRVTAAAELYDGRYLTLEGDYVPVAHRHLMQYRKLAEYLPGVSGMSMLGCPIEGVPSALQPLYEKLYCWKWGISGGDAIWDGALLDALYELWALRAQQVGREIADIFRGSVYLLSPLKLGSVEAAQIEYFHRKGLRVHIGTMGSIGATAPITQAGAMVLQLAERLLIAHIQRALWGSGQIQGGSALAVMDMRTMAFRYGRPEANALILRAGALAREMGLPQSYHAGLSDAKAPSFEAGVQKAVSAVLAALTGGHGHIVAGLLSVDEVFSPLQMALDGELCRFLNHSLLTEAVDEDALAYETLLEVDHGAMFIDQEHTALHLRKSAWQPNLFSREMLNSWREQGCRLDVDYARELCLQIMHEKPDLQPQITEDEERSIQKIIDNAAKGMGI